MIKRFIYLNCALLAFSCSSRTAAETIFSEPRPYVNRYPNLKTAVFAGGCFWCMEAPFEKLRGVKTVISGYTGGREKNPTYDQVSYGKTSHIESVLILYDPAQVSYAQLLSIFWRNINPEQADGQFYDIGSQYKTCIFYSDEAERVAAEKSKAELMRTGKFTLIATGIRPAAEFWPAEDYHQDYYKKNPDHYERYRKGSGRDEFLKNKWQ